MTVNIKLVDGEKLQMHSVDEIEIRTNDAGSREIVVVKQGGPSCFFNWSQIVYIISNKVEKFYEN